MSIELKRLEVEVGVLRKENEALRIQMAELRELLTPTFNFPVEWELPRREAQILALLVTLNRPLTKASYMQLVLADNPSYIPADIVESHVSKLRKRCRKLNLPIEFHSKRFEGYSISADSKVFLEKFLGTTNV